MERELRVASRKSSSFWTRIAGALVALVIGGGFLILTALSASGFGGLGPATLGKALFGVLTWLSLAVALSAGLFFTSDCLSEEKREGTLGLLFLTNLHGYDIVLGKLLVTSLRGFYALLAVLPVLAITLLMGGVTGTEFGRTSLALLSALLVSLASGLFVSALSRDSQRAMAGTLFLLLLWAAAGPAADAILATVRGRPSEPILSLSSPVSLFLMAGAWGQPPFWRGLLVNAAITGLLLALASLLIRRTWHPRAAASATPMRTWSRWWRFGGVERREALRRRLLDVNPVLWLACRERWQAASLWAIALLLAGAFAVLFGTGDDGLWWFGWHYLTGPVTLLLYLGAASQVARAFVEARRSGLLELVLSTPLTADEIVRGQWRALVRLFGLPLAMCLLTQGVGNALVQHRMWSQMALAGPPATAAAATAPIAAVTNTVTTSNFVATTTTVQVRVAGSGATAMAGPGFSPPGSLVAAASALASLVTVAANLAALAWFGMWMGLISKTTNLATLKTVLFVQVIPWFVILFASAALVPLLLMPRLIAGGQAASASMAFWFPILIAAVTALLSLGKDAFFLTYARGRLHTDLRNRKFGRHG